MDLSIRVEKLCKYYWDKGRIIKANHNITFDTDGSKFMLIVRPNGAGKTTLILQLSTVLKPTSGRIRIMGIDAVEHPETVRKYIGLMPQDGMPKVDLTVWENLYLFSRLYGLSKKESLSRCEHIIKMFGLEPYIDKVASSLSGGYRKRVLLAISLLNDPKILFLDEPTSQQDITFREVFYRYIDRLLQMDKMIVYTTNDPYDIRVLSDKGKILVLKGGQLRYYGLGKELVVERYREYKDILKAIMDVMGGA
jgi:ABC-2 type transport system ATP-binding protein